MAHRISITELDRSVLGPLAEHRILIVPQVALLLGVSDGAAERRLRRLDEGGLVQYGPVFHRLPGAALITRRGLDAIEHTLPAPRLDLRGYRHDVGVGWLWLAARAGAFGQLGGLDGLGGLGGLGGLAADRRMRAEDKAAAAAGEPVPFGVGLGMLGPHGRPQHHYPDLVLDMADGNRVAIELELTAKSSRRMARIMTAYASDARVDAVIYLVASAGIAELVTDSARRAGIADRVHVQQLAPDPIAGVDVAATRVGAGRAGAARVGAGRAGAARVGAGRAGAAR